MKEKILLAMVFLTLGCNSQKQVDSNTYSSINTNLKVVDRIILDLNNDKINDTIILSDPQIDGDPGIFRKIRIAGKNLSPFELNAGDAWDKIPNDFKSKDNIIESDKVYIKKNKDTFIIGLFGWFYSSGREDFALISVNGNSVKLLTKDPFDTIEKIEDLDKDGNLELVVKKGWEESIEIIDSLSVTVQTYCPYLVYTIRDNKITKNENLAKDYNQKHYVYIAQDSLTKNTYIVYNERQKSYQVYKK